MGIFDNKPEDFFQQKDIIVHDITSSPGLSGLNVGYEETKWRYDEFSEYLIEWLPEFALNYTNLTQINHANSRRFLKQAAKTVYQTDKYRNRGEFGELILHALIRFLFNSQPVISKIFFKTAANDTVKGFDAVHLVAKGDNLELWLGEAKFFQDINSAIKEVISELKQHCQRNYLREEFILISNKIDSNWEYADRLKKLFSSRNSLDIIFSKICFPVLLTYESGTVRNSKSITEEFITKLRKELYDNYNIFINNLSQLSIKVHLILLPLDDKKQLVDCLNEKLGGLQK